MFIIQRIDQGGGYVAPSGSIKSYVKHYANARIFKSKEDALRHACGNEIVLPLQLFLDALVEEK